MILSLATLALLGGCDEIELELDSLEAPGTDIAGHVVGFGEETSPMGEGPSSLDYGAVQAAPAIPASLGANSHHRIYYGNCAPGSDCDTTIEMTGEGSPLFDTVDNTMRKYMSLHCVSGGNLALSRRGRRVHKRGYGRTKGAASATAICPLDSVDPNAVQMLPDTPLMMGSVSKWVTASIARQLIAERITQKINDGVIDPLDYADEIADPTTARVFDSALELMPLDIIRYFNHDGLAPSDNNCPPVAFGAQGTCTRSTVLCQDNGNPTAPDMRWADVTVGDIIAHTGGLPNGFPSYWNLQLNAAKLRDNTTRNDWVAERASLQAKTQYPNELSQAQLDVASELNVAADDVFFVDFFNSTDSEHTLDDAFKAAASICLDADPGEVSDTNPAGTGSLTYRYSNFGYDLLTRITAHLNAEVRGGFERFAASPGFPNEHDGTALADLLADAGLGRGVSSERAVFHRQVGYAPGYEDPISTQRDWNDALGVYEWEVPSVNRPFCVWTGSECSFTDWRDDADGTGNLRYDWDFDLDLLPFNRSSTNFGPSLSAGGGALAGEAAALVELLKTHFPATQGIGHKQGMLRGPVNEGLLGWKSGALPGGRAWVGAFPTNPANPSATTALNLPPRDVDGQLISLPNSITWSNVSVDEPEHVNLAVLLNQTTNELGSWIDIDNDGDLDWVHDGNVRSVSTFLRWGMREGDGTDWDAVDRSIHDQRHHVVGMTMNHAGDTWYFYETDDAPDDRDEVVRSWVGNPSTHMGSATPNVEYSYQAAATRIGSDLSAVAIRDEIGPDKIYAWYKDGHYSVGWYGPNTDLDFYGPLGGEYTLPTLNFGSGPIQIARAGTYDELISVAFNAAGVAYSWYTNGERATGETGNLGLNGKADYTIAAAQSYAEIESISIDWANGDRVWVRYRDGSVSEGTSTELAKWGYWPAPPLTMSIESGETTLYYGNGWSRTFTGTPLASRDGANQIASGDWNTGGTWGDYFEPNEVIGIGSNGSDGHIWYSTNSGEVAQWSGGAPVDGAPTTLDMSGTGVTAGRLVGTATAAGGWVYSWTVTGDRMRGDSGDPDAHAGTASYVVSAGQSYSTIAAVAIGTNDRVWTHYVDGTISEGWSTNLGSVTYPSPW